MKTNEELNALREEAEALSRKLHELSREELAQVVGGWEYSDLPEIGIGHEMPPKNDDEKYVM